jgi:hypothetical protein
MSEERNQLTGKVRTHIGERRMRRRKTSHCARPKGTPMMINGATKLGIDFRIGRGISNTDMLINPRRLAAIQIRNAFVVCL